MSTRKGGRSGRIDTATRRGAWGRDQGGRTRRCQDVAVGRDRAVASGGGVRKKEITGRLDVDLKSVRRTSGGSTARVRVSPPRPSTLDAWRERIRQRLREEPRLTAKRIRRLGVPVAASGPAARGAPLLAGQRVAGTTKEGLCPGSALPGATMQVDFDESWIDMAAGCGAGRPNAVLVGHVAPPRSGRARRGRARSGHSRSFEPVSALWATTTQGFGSRPRAAAPVREPLGDSSTPRPPVCSTSRRTCASCVRSSTRSGMHRRRPGWPRSVRICGRCRRVGFRSTRRSSAGCGSGARSGSAAGSTRCRRG